MSRPTNNSLAAPDKLRLLATSLLLTLSLAQNAADAHDVRLAGPFPHQTDVGTIDALADGRIVYVASDYAQIWDPKARRWNARQLGSSRYRHTSTVLPGGRLAFIGGIASDGSNRSQENALSTTTVWNSQTGAWDSGLSLLTPRFAHTAVALDSGDIVVIGGASSAQHGEPFGPLLATVELVGDKTTTKRNSLGVARAYHTAQRTGDGIVMVAGGIDDTGHALASVELYDAAQDVWRDGPSLLIARSRHTMTILADGSILVTGGEDSKGNPVTMAELWNPTANAWEPAGAMAEARSSHQATRLSNGDVLISGGLRSTYQTNLGTRSGYPARTLELWRSAKRLWQAVGEAPIDARDLRAVLSNDDTVLLFGADGYGSGAFAWLPDEEEDAPVAESLSSVITPAGDGRYLITGGSRRQQHVASASLYNSKTNRWTSANPMHFARSNHRAVRLNDGRILALGGTIHGVATERDSSPEDQQPAEKQAVLFPAEIWDPTTGAWTLSATLKYASGTWAEPAILADGRVALGVVNNENRFDPAVHLFRIWNPADDSLGELTQVPRTRAEGHALFYADGHLLYAGGNDQTRVRMDPRCQDGGDEESEVAPAATASTADPCVEVIETSRDGKRLDWWDPIKRNWRELRPAELSLNGLVMEPLNDGGVLAWRGREQDERYSTPSDPATAKQFLLWQPSLGWRTLAFPAEFDGGYIRPIALSKGDLLVRAALRSWLWRQATQEWLAIQNDAPNEALFDMFAEASGRVIAFRQRNSAAVHFTPMEAVWLNRDAGRWEPLTQSYVPRPHPAAVRLRDGRVLVAGGDVNIAQLWTPAREQWRFTGYLNTPLRKPKGLLLKDDRVMVVGYLTTNETKFFCEIWNPHSEAFAPCGEFSGTQEDAYRGTVLRYLDDSQVLLVFGRQKAFVWSQNGEWVATKLQIPKSSTAPQADEKGTAYLNAIANVWNPAQNRWEDGADILFNNELQLPTQAHADGSLTALQGWSRLLAWTPADKLLRSAYLRAPSDASNVRTASLPNNCIVAWPDRYDLRYTQSTAAFVLNTQDKKWISSSVTVDAPTAASSIALEDGTVALLGQRLATGMGRAMVRLRASCDEVEPSDNVEALYLPASGKLTATAPPPPALGPSTPLQPKAPLSIAAQWQAQWSAHLAGIHDHPQSKFMVGGLLVILVLRRFMRRCGAYNLDTEDGSGLLAARRLDYIVIAATLPLLALTLGIPHATTQVLVSSALALAAAASARRLWDNMHTPRDKAIYAAPMLATAALAAWIVGAYVTNAFIRMTSLD